MGRKSHSDVYINMKFRKIFWREKPAENKAAYEKIAKQMGKKEKKRVSRLKSIKFWELVIKKGKAILEFGRTIYSKQKYNLTWWYDSDWW